MRHRKAGFLCHLLIKLPVHRLIDIKYTTTLVTTEMVMVMSESVIPAQGPANVKFQNLTPPAQRIQIPVYRPQADIRYLSLHLVIDPVCGGMGPGTSQYLQYCLFLPSLLFHLFDNDYRYLHCRLNFVYCQGIATFSSLSTASFASRSQRCNGPVPPEPYLCFSAASGL